jgi:hypothetical protein
MYRGLRLLIAAALLVAAGRRPAGAPAHRRLIWPWR